MILEIIDLLRNKQLRNNVTALLSICEGSRWLQTETKNHLDEYLENNMRKKEQSELQSWIVQVATINGIRTAKSGRRLQNVDEVYRDVLDACQRRYKIALFMINTWKKCIPHR